MLNEVVYRLQDDAERHATDHEQHRFFSWLFRNSCPNTEWQRSWVRRMERIFRRRAALILLLAELLANSDDVTPAHTGRDDEVAPMVTQLVGSLSEAPASPPALRVALAAA